MVDVLFLDMAELGDGALNSPSTVSAAQHWRIACG